MAYRFIGGIRAMNDPESEIDVPRVISHRGAAGHAPENTLAGIRKAAALGARWVEFDVKLTRDSVPVLLHDPRLNRTTNARGILSRMDLAQIRGVDAGSWYSAEFAGECIPTLAEAIALTRSLGLGANIEIKATRGRHAETAARSMTLIADAWADNPDGAMVSSFSAESLAVARDLAPRIRRGLLMRRKRRIWRDEAARLGCYSVHCRQSMLTRRVIAEFRATPFHLFCFTVNDPVRARQLYEWGVESIITDFPDRILAI
jgi:glycerophosphoryl diester phosphodiesterase